MKAERRDGALAFKQMRDTVEVTNSAPSKQVAALESAGYLSVGMSFTGTMPRISARPREPTATLRKSPANRPPEASCRNRCGWHPGRSTF
ncbi:transcriptional regulator [Cryobacterium sp. W22_MBD10_FK3]|uniref:transcriptional regulator n=1 Tax=Cryobacterium sp. W22_MBD10_FK3 TaxID=3240273 RepID=UPI003F8DAA5A